MVDAAWEKKRGRMLRSQIQLLTNIATLHYKYTIEMNLLYIPSNIVEAVEKCLMMVWMDVVDELKQ